MRISSYINKVSKSAKSLLLLTTLLSGCAMDAPVAREDRVNNTKTTQINILDETTNMPLNGVNCSIQSQKGRHLGNFNRSTFTIPSNMVLHSDTYVMLRCTKNGYSSLERQVRSTANDNSDALKNALMSSAIGALTGFTPINAPVYVLPQNVTVKMRKLGK